MIQEELVYDVYREGEWCRTFAYKWQVDNYIQILLDRGIADTFEVKEVRRAYVKLD